MGGFLSQLETTKISSRPTHLPLVHWSAVAEPAPLANGDAVFVEETATPALLFPSPDFPLRIRRHEAFPQKNGDERAGLPLSIPDEKRWQSGFPTGPAGRLLQCYCCICKMFLGVIGLGFFARGISFDRSLLEMIQLFGGFLRF